MSLLHVAAMFNCTEIALLLVEAGADPEMRNCQDESVRSVLHRFGFVGALGLLHSPLTLTGL